MTLINDEQENADLRRILADTIKEAGRSSEAVDNLSAALKRLAYYAMKLHDEYCRAISGGECDCAIGQAHTALEKYGRK